MTGANSKLAFNRPETKKERESVKRTAGTSRAWLVVVSNRGKEGLVVPQLLRHDIEVYRPMAHKVVTHARQSVIKAVPLYPGHLFVRGRESDRGYGHISGMMGVAWIYPRMLLDQCIQRHREEEQDGFIELAKTFDPDLSKVKTGDRIRTLDGLLEVVVTETHDEYRVAALSGFMNGNSRLTVDVSWLAK